MLFRAHPANSALLPKSVRVYAIGDVHGEAALLRELLRLIDADNEARKRARVFLVVLGDLIDRGADGAMLVQLFARLAGEQVIVLKGNHEDGLVAAYRGDETALSGWLSFGGEKTLAGFGLTPGEMTTPAEAISGMRVRIDRKLIDWIDVLPTHWQCGDYFFAHAGVRPGVRLTRQNTDDLLWIREPFLSSRRDHGKVVVHGHSVEPGVPRLGSNRIGIDTGGHEHGTLTALGLEGRDQWLLQANGQRPAAFGEAIESMDRDQLQATGPTALLQEIEALVASITDDQSRLVVHVPPSRELTAEFSPGSIFVRRIRGGLGKRGQAAGIFAVVLCALGAATFYSRWPTLDRHPTTAVVTESPVATPPFGKSLPTKTVDRPELPQPNRATSRPHHARGKQPRGVRRDEAIRSMQTTQKKKVPFAPVLYGAELEAALARDRVVTREFNDGELARLQVQTSH